MLHPGDVRCGERGDQLVTLLGSCVAVVMTDPKRTIGCMSHIVHIPPRRPSAQPRSSAWADVALDRMGAELRARGLEPRLCEAYLYGGGNMFPLLVPGGHVGQSNAEWVRRALDDMGLKVLHHDLGGEQYRRLRWTVGPDAPVVEKVAV